MLVSEVLKPFIAWGYLSTGTGDNFAALNQDVTGAGGVIEKLDGSVRIKYNRREHLVPLDHVLVLENDCCAIYSEDLFVEKYEGWIDDRNYIKATRAMADSNASEIEKLKKEITALKAKVKTVEANND